MFAFFDPTGRGGMDAGIIEFKPEPDDRLSKCVPLEFGNLEDVRVGNDIGICGFPFGNTWLVDAPGVWRFGAIVHQGMISAVSPFDTVNPREITTFLTDLNSAKGMSGSPVFLPADGKVIGLHYAGEVGTLGCAIPLDEKRVSGWVSFYQRVFTDPSRPRLTFDSVKITGGGDIEEL